ncbi:MAG: S-methyl-5-thioribose-1-phosphate isomerase [Rhodospirillaceae bacterium]|nr:S-methyl-5-thioribose-1-phosphate isomerase [Rhodospirillaceae bacterium]
MKIDGRPYRTIWPLPDGRVRVIDQTLLPFDFATVDLATVDDAARAITAMIVRGAPLIGATAAYGVALAMRDDPSDVNLQKAYATLLATRPTAVNLKWALDRALRTLGPLPASERAAAASELAAQICDDDVATNQAIGRHGLVLIRAAHQHKPSKPVNILTHCNAGWLATVDWGTALAPIYMAHDSGIPVHVWVDETRPRNQGAALTTWELARHGVPHTLIVDNAGGHLMQHAKVDLCIVGTDRTTAAGDVCNKVGTYLKALAAAANDVPFYVAAPASSIDWTLRDGVRDIPIETRASREITHLVGRRSNGKVDEFQIAPTDTPALNIAFDVTPARYVTGLITERGVCGANDIALRGLFPDLAGRA